MKVKSLVSNIVANGYSIRKTNSQVGISLTVFFIIGVYLLPLIIDVLNLLQAGL